MTTFQALIYGIIHGFSEFLPISSSAHHVLVPYLIGWERPTGALAGALSLGASLSLLIYFRHDWASMISSLLKVILFRTRPMTIDERMPIFILISLIPLGAASYFLHSKFGDIEWEPLQIAASLALFSVPLVLSDSISRRNKSMSDWSWLDSLTVGISQIAMLVPGCGIQGGSLPAALFRNYNREAAVKFVFFLITPIVIATACFQLRDVDFHAPSPMHDMSWLSFGVALVVTTLTGLLAIGGFMKNLQRKGFGQYVAYRWLLGTSILVVYWLRNRS